MIYLFENSIASSSIVQWNTHLILKHPAINPLNSPNCVFKRGGADRMLHWLSRPAEVTGQGCQADMPLEDVGCVDGVASSDGWGHREVTHYEVTPHGGPSSCQLAIQLWRLCPIKYAQGFVVLRLAIIVLYLTSIYPHTLGLRQRHCGNRNIFFQ